MQIARANVVLPTPRSPVNVTISGGVMDRPSCSPQCRSSLSVSLRWPFVARGGTRCRWAGILAAVEARQRSSALSGLSACLRLHLEKLVTDARGSLEIEIGRCLAHLCLELGDQRRQIVLPIMSACFGYPATLLFLPLLALRPCISHTCDKPHFTYTLLDAHRCDPVLAVVSALQLATPIRLLDAALHGARHFVGVEDGASTEMSRGAPDRLNQRAIAAQESFLVGVKNRDEGNLRQIETFAQQIDSDQHIELAQPQAPNNLHAFDGVDVGMHVAHT